MSRVSIARRIDRVRQMIRPKGSLEGRMDALPDDLRAEFQIWSERVNAIISLAKNRCENAYGNLLDDPAYFLVLPVDIELALWPEMRKVYAEPNARRAYDLMLEQECDR